MKFRLLDTLRGKRWLGLDRAAPLVSVTFFLALQLMMGLFYYYVS